MQNQGYDVAEDEEERVCSRPESCSSLGVDEHYPRNAKVDGCCEEGWRDRKTAKVHDEVCVDEWVRVHENAPDVADELPKETEEGANQVSGGAVSNAEEDIDANQEAKYCSVESIARDAGKIVPNGLMGLHQEQGDMSTRYIGRDCSGVCC